VLRYKFCAIVLLCLASFTISCRDLISRNGVPRAKEGILDLSSRDFAGETTIKLDGQWEFYWEKLLTSDDFQKTPPPEKDGYIDVPTAWNGHVVKGKKPGGDGYATYRLTVMVGQKSGPIAFRIMDMRTAYSMFVNGEKIASNGTVGTTRETSRPQYLPVLTDYTPKTDRLEIILQISNYHHMRGGAFHSISIGNNKAIHSARDLSLSFQIFMLGSLLIMALYHLGLFLLRRNDRSPLYLGLFCLLIAIRPLINGEFCLIQISPDFNWEVMLKTEVLTLYLGLPFFAMFMNSLFPFEFNNKILRPLQVIGAVFSAIVIVTPAYIYSKTVVPYEIITLLVSIYSVYAIMLAFIRKREGSGIFITGILILFITVVNEILYDNMIVNTGNFFPFGLFFFVLSQAFLLSLRFSKAFVAVERLSRELENSNLQLVNMDKLKDDFLANTSHELRTPLNGIIGIAESLLDGAAGNLPETVSSNLAMIISSGRRLSNLISDLLDFSKLRNKDITLKMKAVDIKTLTDVAIDLTAHLKVDKNISVINSIPSDIPLMMADEDRMQQILINLISNSIKFTETGKVEISAQVLVGENPEYSLMEITVADTGIGIPEDKIPEIFQPFEQVDGSISRLYNGTGIGLSITKDLLRLHGGYIEVESEPGKGSSFIFRIPIRRPPETPEHAPSEAKAPVKKKNWRDNIPAKAGTPFDPLAFAPVTDQPTILVVDDDPVNLQVLENQLSVQNYNVIKSTSGSDALDKINTGLNPDLVILDVMMPKMSGLDVSRIIRERHPLYDLPIMILTAKSRISDMTAGLDAGANDYLAKPFDKTELLARVKTLIRLKKTVDENKKLTSIKQEIELARKIHFSTIPEELPQVANLDIVVKYIPMQVIGGDFYDFHKIDENRIGAFISDISGHGIPAAIVASMVKIAFSMLKDVADHPGQLMKEMNRILTGNIENSFVTAGYAVIDREAMKLYYIRSGHEPLLLYHKKTNALEEITPAGRLIGFSWADNYEVHESNIEQGDRIIMYTDGFLEVYNKEREIMNINFLKNAIIRGRELSATDLADSLTGLLKRWRGLDEEFEDDVTIVVIDIL
jgi:two-component system, sensor histidine kinase ChiS